MLITKIKNPCGKFSTQPKYKYQKQNLHVAYQFLLWYPVSVDVMVLQEHLVYLQNTGNKIWLM